MIIKFPTTYGPFKCEGYGCTQKTQICVISDKNEQAMVKCSNASIVLTRRLGNMVCANCLTKGAMEQYDRKRIALITGSHEEAKHFLDRQIIPIFHKDRVRGHDIGRIILYGNYWRNPVIEDLWIERLGIVDFAVGSLHEEAKVFHEDLSEFKTTTVGAIIDGGHPQVERYTFRFRFR